MPTEVHQEYDEELTAVLEAVWGEGFMSPGGSSEIDRVLRGMTLEGKQVLDFGCGLGGASVHMASQYMASVTGVDIEAGLIERCRNLAAKYNVSHRTHFICVQPGPLPFESGFFDVVTSKDAIIHIADKRALMTEVCRVLKPGGFFSVGDWLAGYEGAPPHQMKAYIAAEGLDFGLASSTVYLDAIDKAGFFDITIVDRTAWYREVARSERLKLAGDLHEALIAVCGSKFVHQQIEVWDKMIRVLDLGYLRPTHLRAQKYR